MAERREENERGNWKEMKGCKNKKKKTERERETVD